MFSIWRIGGMQPEAIGRPGLVGNLGDLRYARPKFVTVDFNVAPQLVAWPSQATRMPSMV
jgi:hypothetical protein